MEKKLWIYAGKTSIIIKVTKKITYCFCKTWEIVKWWYYGEDALCAKRWKRILWLKKQLNNDKSSSLSKALKEFVDIFEKWYYRIEGKWKLEKEWIEVDSYLR